VYARDLTSAVGDGAVAGFSGRPLRLGFSYRLPPSLIPPLNDFRTTFLGSTDLPPLEAGTTEVGAQLAFGCHLRWHQTDLENFEDQLAIVALAAPDVMGLNPADVVVLVARNSTGLKLVRRLQDNGHRVKHVFGESMEERRWQRRAFWKGQTYLASTIHSFKGYEQRGVVLGVAGPRDESDADSLITTYIGLTRVKAMADGSAALVVVCADERLRAFGDRWFDRWCGSTPSM
jgi:hypothetical protein